MYVFLLKVSAFILFHGYWVINGFVWNAQKFALILLFSSFWGVYFKLTQASDEIRESLVVVLYHVSSYLRQILRLSKCVASFFLHFVNVNQTYFVPLCYVCFLCIPLVHCSCVSILSASQWPLIEPLSKPGSNLCKHPFHMLSVILWDEVRYMYKQSSFFTSDIASLSVDAKLLNIGGYARFSKETKSSLCIPACIKRVVSLDHI